MAAADLNIKRLLRVVSFNMHGFNQGQPTIEELINSSQPDIILLQEHWLTPANLNKFDKFRDYFTFGTSAMSKAVESGMLKGRPFGGVISMIRNDLRSATETIYCSDRCNIVRVANLVFVNVYLPCVGTADRLLICQDLLADILSWIERFPDCQWLLAGGFNVDLYANEGVAS